MSSVSEFDETVIERAIRYCKQNLVEGSLWEQCWTKGRAISFYDYSTNFKTKSTLVTVEPKGIVMVVGVTFYSTSQVVGLKLIHGDRLYERVRYDCSIWLERFKRVK